MLPEMYYYDRNKTESQQRVENYKREIERLEIRIQELRRMIREEENR